MPTARKAALFGLLRLLFSDVILTMHIRMGRPPKQHRLHETASELSPSSIFEDFIGHTLFGTRQSCRPAAAATAFIAPQPDLTFPAKTHIGIETESWHHNDVVHTAGLPSLIWPTVGQQAGFQSTYQAAPITFSCSPNKVHSQYDPNYGFCNANIVSLQPTNPALTTADGTPIEFSLWCISQGIVPPKTGHHFPVFPEKSWTDGECLLFQRYTTTSHPLLPFYPQELAQCLTKLAFASTCWSLPELLDNESLGSMANVSYSVVKSTYC